MEIFAGVMIIFAIALIVFGIAITALIYFCLWKLYVKCHRKVWEWLKPIYNIYVFCKMSGTKIMWGIILMVVPIVNMVVRIFNTISKVVENDFIAIIFSIIALALALASLVATYVSSYVINNNLAKRFNKDIGFVIGLILVPIVFIPILAFGKDEYHEPQVES